MGRAPVGICVVLGLCLATSCEQSTPDGLTTTTIDESQVRIFMTDAPSEFVASAEVGISRAVLGPGPGGQEIDLLEAGGVPKMHDLMDLRNGVQTLLADRLIPPANYRRLRFVVESATVTLVDGHTFADGSTTMPLSIPSGIRNGIEVQLAGDVEAVDGVLTLLVLDFDVDQSFIMQGHPDAPGGIRGFAFAPVIVETERVALPMN